MMLQCRLPRDLRAFEITVEGVEYYAIAKTDLDGLHRRGEADADKAPAGRREPAPARSRKPRATVRPSARKTHEVTARPSPKSDAVIDLLRKQPLSSAEVIERLKTEPENNVYGILHLLRKSGIIQMVVGEDGVRRNALTEAA